MKTDLEQRALTAIRELGEAAYGVPIWHAVERSLGRSISIGSLYVTLERLEEKGLVVHHDEPGGPERGGRIKRCWRIRY